MKLTAQKTVEEEIDFDLSTPKYRHFYGAIYLKIYEQEGELRVIRHTDGLTTFSIEERKIYPSEYSAIFCEENWEEVTEQEYKSALLERIQKHNILQ